MIHKPKNRRAVAAACLVRAEPSTHEVYDTFRPRRYNAIDELTRNSCQPHGAHDRCLGSDRLVARNSGLQKHASWLGHYETEYRRCVRFLRRRPLVEAKNLYKESQPSHYRDSVRINDIYHRLPDPS